MDFVSAPSKELDDHIGVGVVVADFLKTSWQWRIRPMACNHNAALRPKVERGRNPRWLWQCLADRPSKQASHFESNVIRAGCVQVVDSALKLLHPIAVLSSPGLHRNPHMLVFDDAPSRASMHPNPLLNDQPRHLAETAQARSTHIHNQINPTKPFWFRCVFFLLLRWSFPC